MPKGLIVTGTDTGIGKTMVSAGLVGGLGLRYWKPVQSGLEEETDSETVARLVPGAVVLPEAYKLQLPASPHLSARVEGVEIVPERLSLPEGPLLVEGAGGVLVPLSETRLYVEQFAEWGLPVVLVARTGLGTINHTLLSIEALRARGCVLAGVAFVGDENAENERFICAYAKARRLGCLPMLAEVTPATLRTAIAENFDLSGLIA